MIGRWLCNLGFHQPIGRPGAGQRAWSGKTETYGNATIPYLECQRCGRWYIGTVTIKDSYRFPLDRPAGPDR